MYLGNDVLLDIGLLLKKCSVLLFLYIHLQLDRLRLLHSVYVFVQISHLYARSFMHKQTYLLIS